ncbi:9490_t:CDS:2 [Cetraspora pellucida]|uniref:9490_t:CDS:1 n=1 Tax=Cetraspora pellucida TaxID=1433469 RepID=A0A9N9I4R4_9GLOM|nr:9490_t:CDS:2 [Cetraspora pellucida]
MTLLKPSKSSYTKASRKMWFTYLTGSNKFQHGLLGLTDSYIAGNLFLEFPEPKPLKVKQIEVLITGTENNELKEELFKDITKINYPFQFPLPNDLPSTMDLGVNSYGIPQSMDMKTCRIYYKVQARIIRNSNFLKFQSSQKKIKCKCLITRYSPMPRPETVRWTEWDNSKALKCGLSYDISMDYNTFGPNNPIIVKLIIKFLKINLNIREIFIGLKEYHQLKALGNTKISERYIQERIIYGNQIQVILNNV